MEPVDLSLENWNRIRNKSDSSNNELSKGLLQKTMSSLGYVYIMQNCAHTLTKLVSCLEAS